MEDVVRLMYRVESCAWPPEPLYNIKYATSLNGITWLKTNITAIDNDDFGEAIGKPYVFMENGIFKMITHTEILLITE